ncbi:4618_t:CDS:2, partial [Ambispora leptoticha]
NKLKHDSKFCVSSSEDEANTEERDKSEGSDSDKIEKEPIRKRKNNSKDSEK